MIIKKLRECLISFDEKEKRTFYKELKKYFGIKNTDKKAIDAMQTNFRSFKNTGASSVENLEAYFTVLNRLPGRDLKTTLGFNKQSWSEQIAKSALGKIPERLHKHLEDINVREEFTAILQNIILACEQEDNTKKLRTNMSVINSLLELMITKRTPDK